jgi:DNA polymerase (family X)
VTESAPAPSTHEVAHLLAEIGTLMELNGRDSFRARAFTSAARALDGVDADLLDLARQQRLTTLRGVGSGIASIIREYIFTGRSTLQEELRAATPPGLHDLMRVPGLGTKRIHALHAELGIEGLDALEAAARAGKIAALSGFGPRTEAKILEGIAFARSTRQRRRYPEALEVAARLVDWLRDLPGVEDARIAGALRRRMEIVDGIDLLAATRKPELVSSAVRSLAEPVGTSTGGLPDARSETTIRLSDGIFVRVRSVPPDRLAAALLWETGSSAHLDALGSLAAELGGKLDSEGLSIAGTPFPVSSEEELYERLGLAYVPPELREGLGELRESAEGTRPLLELGDLRGTFHCHTTYSDGKASLVEMAAGARERGWEYLGIADHSRTASYAGGLTFESVRRQHLEIDSLNRGFDTGPEPFRLFKGIESDILPDGSLDYPVDILREFDYVIGSVHASFGMPADEMTARMVRAIEHPALTILGHLTGRLLLTREGYALDMEAVLAAAARSATIIEINANPHRLDLDWRHVRTAAELGILIAVNPDAHSVAALDHVVYGVNMARKAGLAPEQVLNTWTTEEIGKYFAARKLKI